MFAQQLQPLKYIDLILSHFHFNQTFSAALKRKLKRKSAKQWVWLKDLCINYFYMRFLCLSFFQFCFDECKSAVERQYCAGFVKRWSDKLTGGGGVSWGPVIGLIYPHSPGCRLLPPFSLKKKKKNTDRLSTPLFKHFQCHQHGQCECAVGLNSLNDHKHNLNSSGWFSLRHSAIGCDWNVTGFYVSNICKIRYLHICQLFYRIA